MRSAQSEFHFRHALFALQGADGYVEALMESASRAPRSAAISLARPRGRRAEGDARSTPRAR